MNNFGIVQLVFRAAMAVPVLPATGGILSNRRNPASSVCAPADVMFNVSDKFYPWINRLPGGGQTSAMRGRNGRFMGSINRLP